MKKPHKKWITPKWLVSLLPYIGEDIDSAERAMNCRASADGCDVVVNAPRAIMCTATTAKIGALVALRMRGLIKEDHHE